MNARFPWYWIPIAFFGGLLLASTVQPWLWLIIGIVLGAVGGIYLTTLKKYQQVASAIATVTSTPPKVDFTETAATEKTNTGVQVVSVPLDMVTTPKPPKKPLTGFPKAFMDFINGEGRKKKNV